jgi:hypothetical protein
MSWLPPQFPGNIKCIVSSADDSPTTISRLTEHPCYVCEVGPITRETAELIIDHSLQKFNKVNIITRGGSITVFTFCDIDEFFLILSVCYVT